SQEIILADNVMIVTQTNTKGIINYVNQEFIDISGYSRQELMGCSHNIVRHPDMPSPVFKDLWAHLVSNRPWVGIIKNRCKNGDFYWVEANISPLYEGETLIGYMSVRYKARPEHIHKAELYYRTLLTPGYRPFPWKNLLAQVRDASITGKLITATCMGLAVVTAWWHHPVGLMGVLLIHLFMEYQRTRLETRLMREAQESLKCMAQGDFKHPVHLGYNNELGHVLESIKSAQIRLGFFITEINRIAAELKTEITVRNHFEVQLDEQKWLTKQLETTMSEFALVSVANSEGKITYANPRFCEVSGYSSEELLGQDHRIVNSRYHDAEFFRYLWATIRSGKAWHGEICNKRKNGSFYWVDAVINPVCRKDNIPDYYISVRREITREVDNRNILAEGKLQAEYLLKEKQTQLSVILDNINAAVYLKSPELNYLYVNAQYASLHGLTQDEMLGKTDKDILSTPVATRFAASDQQVLSSGLKLQGLELVSLPGTANEVRYLWGTKIPLKRDDEQVYALLGLATDMTEMKRMEQEKIDYERKNIQLKTEFMANISHEIRTPMNSIMSVSELLRETPLAQDQSGYVDILQYASQHILSLINDMLELSRVNTGDWKLEHTAFRVTETLNSVLRGLLPLAHVKGLMLELNVSDNIPDCLMGSPMRLGQIITNLVGNAIKFTMTGGVIVSVVPVMENPDPLNEGYITLRFAVTDTGIGIAPEHQERIFKAFEQVHELNVEGTGLGLAISSSLIHLMGGTLKLNSISGQGSSFYFDLSMQRCNNADNPIEVGQNPFVALEGKRIMLVEDNAVNQKLAKVRLEKLGCEVITADHGQMALDILSREQVDLILMDMRMPIMDGPAATRLYRQREKESGQTRIPIIALTANAHEEDINLCLESGMDSHVSKPFTLDMLLQGITAAYTLSTATLPETISFDPQSALLLVDDDKALLQELIGLFVADYPALMGTIRQGLDTADSSLGQTAAHSLKGSSSTLAAHLFNSQAAQLENLFKYKQLAEAEIAFAELERTGEMLITALTSYGESLVGSL
ncbi:MAG: PAS domain S-box protein, partial [Methylococcaceae bacterium]